MKKGTVQVNLIYLKKGGYARQGDEITENEIGNFDAMVSEGKIKPAKSYISDADKAKKEANEKAKAEAEEAAKKEANEKAKAEAEEAAKKEANEKAKADKK